MWLFPEHLPARATGWAHPVSKLVQTFVVAGGWGESEKNYSSVVTFLPGATAWTSLASLPWALRCAPASVVGGRLILPLDESAVDCTKIYDKACISLFARFLSITRTTERVGDCWKSFNSTKLSRCPHYQTSTVALFIRTLNEYPFLQTRSFKEQISRGSISARTSCFPAKFYGKLWNLSFVASYYLNQNIWKRGWELSALM